MTTVEGGLLGFIDSPLVSGLLSLQVVVRMRGQHGKGVSLLVVYVEAVSAMVWWWLRLRFRFRFRKGNDGGCGAGVNGGRDVSGSHSTGEVDGCAKYYAVL